MIHNLTTNQKNTYIDHILLIGFCYSYVHYLILQHLAPHLPISCNSVLTTDMQRVNLLFLQPMRGMQDSNQWLTSYTVYIPCTPYLHELGISTF